VKLKVVERSFYSCMLGPWQGRESIFSCWLKQQAKHL